MFYALKYFRDPAVVRWYESRGILDKPVGYVLGQARYPSLMVAQKDADEINKRRPPVPVTVVPVKR